jgi:hypothetical protein
MQFDFLHNQASGGSGDLTLTAVTNEPGLQDAFSASSIDKWVRYSIKGAIKRESGFGKLHNTTGTYTLIRTIPQMTWSGSVYDSTTPTALDFTGETVDVYCAPSAGGVKAAMPYELTRLPSGGIRGRACLPGQGGGIVASTIVTAYRYFFPLVWDTPGSIDRLSFHCSANSAANFRAALYEIDTNGGPGRMAIDFGQTAISGTGVKHSTALGAPVFVPSGEYMIGFQVDAGSIGVSGTQYNACSSWLGITSSGTPVAALSRLVAYGAFVDESGGTFNDVSGQPNLVLNKS